MTRKLRNSSVRWSLIKTNPLSGCLGIGGMSMKDTPGTFCGAITPRRWTTLFIWSNLPPSLLSSWLITFLSRGNLNCLSLIWFNWRDEKRKPSNETNIDCQTQLPFICEIWYINGYGAIITIKASDLPCFESVYVFEGKVYVKKSRNDSRNEDTWISSSRFRKPSHNIS